MSKYRKHQNMICLYTTSEQGPTSLQRPKGPFPGVAFVRRFQCIYQQKYFATGATAHTSAYFGEGSGPIHLDFVQCSGSEYNLTECEIQHDRVNHIRTNHSSDVGVKCQPGKVHVYLLEKPMPSPLVPSFEPVDEQCHHWP